MPTQTRVLAYFSGTSAWLNALHVFVMYVGASTLASNLDHGHDAARVNQEETSERTALVVDETTLGDEPRSRPTATDQRSESSCSSSRILRSCSAAADAAENCIRSHLERSLLLRGIVGLLLSLLIAAVLVAVVWRVWQWWVLALPLVSVAFVGSFHLLLRRQRRETGVSRHKG